MTALPADPLLQFRRLWDSIEASGVGIRQQEVAARSGTISHLVGEDSGVSAAYLSQILSPEKYKKKPTLGKVAVASLALRAEFQRHRSTISDEFRRPLDDAFTILLETLRVQPTTWTEPDRPLSAYSENLVVRTQAERTMLEHTAREQFSLVIRGGYRTGKTTFLARTADRCRSLGYRVYDIDTASIAANTLNDAAADVSSVYGQFATLLGVESKPATMPELNAVIEKEIGRATDPAVLIIDDFNTLITALGGHSELTKALCRSWMQRASRASGASPWRRLSVAVASTFSPAIVRPADIASVYPTYTNVEIGEFTAGEAAQLLALWVGYHRSSSKLPDEEERADILERANTWFDGQPYLVHDFVSTWLANPATTAPGPDTALTPNQSGFLDDLATLVERSLVVPGDKGQTTDVGPHAGSGEDLTLAGTAKVFANLGIIRSELEHSFSSPFLQQHFPNRLRVRMGR